MNEARWARRDFMLASMTAIALGVPLLSVPPVRAQQPAPFSLWGHQASVQGSIDPFEKWTGVMERHAREMTLLDGPCDASPYDACNLRLWMNFIDSLENLFPRRQIEETNDFFNQYPYVEDIDNWGVTDHWSTPLQFLSRSGDCEDYSIIKYYTLKKLDHDIEAMRIIVLQDESINVLHAVLCVLREGEFLILDNQIDGVVPAGSIRHYTPIYAINEITWWRF